MVGDVDTSRLAIPGTQFAVYAFVLVNHRLQPRETGKEPQHRTYRTNGIAVSPPIPPRQYSYYNTNTPIIIKESKAIKKVGRLLSHTSVS